MSRAGVRAHGEEGVRGHHGEGVQGRAAAAVRGRVPGRVLVQGLQQAQPGRVRRPGSPPRHRWPVDSGQNVDVVFYKDYYASYTLH